jgi:hypothetical protein
MLAESRSSCPLTLAENSVIEVVRALCYVYDNDPRLNYNLAVGLKGVIQQVDSGGDILVNFEGVGKKWLLQADFANIQVIAESKDDMPGLSIVSAPDCSTIAPIQIKQEDKAESPSDQATQLYVDEDKLDDILANSAPVEEPSSIGVVNGCFGYSANPTQRENDDDSQDKPATVEVAPCPTGQGMLVSVETASSRVPNQACVPESVLRVKEEHGDDEVMFVAQSKSTFDVGTQTTPFAGLIGAPLEMEIPMPRWTAADLCRKDTEIFLAQVPSPTRVRCTVQDVARPSRQRFSQKDQADCVQQLRPSMTAAEEDALFADVFAETEAEEAHTPDRHEYLMSPASLGHTLRPALQGTRVAVIGDGWGGGSGGYEGVITEADAHTYTLVGLDGPQSWKETHVLKKYAIPLMPASYASVASSESVVAEARVPMRKKRSRIAGPAASATYRCKLRRKMKHTGGMG